MNMSVRSTKRVLYTAAACAAALGVVYLAAAVAIPVASPTAAPTTTGQANPLAPQDQTPSVTPTPAWMDELPQLASVELRRTFEDAPPQIVETAAAASLPFTLIGTAVEEGRGAGFFQLPDNRVIVAVEGETFEHAGQNYTVHSVGDREATVQSGSVNYSLAMPAPPEGAQP